MMVKQGPNGKTLGLISLVQFQVMPPLSHFALSDSDLLGLAPGCQTDMAVAKDKTLPERGIECL